MTEQEAYEAGIKFITENHGGIYDAIVHARLLKTNDSKCMKKFVEGAHHAKYAFKSKTRKN